MKKEIDADEQEAFIREVTEEVKNDNLKQMWEKYGIYIILLVVLAIVGAVSFEGFKSWRQAKSETWSDTYAYALNLENQGKYDESLKVLEQMEKTGGNIYSDIARLQTSNILFEQGKNEEAIKVLEEIAADKSINKKLRDVSAVKLASYKLDNAPREEIDALLQPLIRENGRWGNIAKEMTAMAAIRDGNIEEAQVLYNEILNTPNLPDGLKMRVQDMLSVLNGAK